MTCREFIDFLFTYVSGELSSSEQATFEEHIAECPDCLTYLRSYEMTIKLGETAYADADPDGDPPENVPEELIQAILSARQTVA